jgi:hypothetical protein
MPTCAVLLSVGLCLLGAPPATGAEPELSPHEIAVTLSQSVVAVGEKVRLKEMIPEASDTECRGVRHSVVKVGRYDVVDRKFVPFDRQEFGNQFLGLERTFPGLPVGMLSYHGFPYRVKEPGRKGFEFEFVPKIPGVYLLSADWVVPTGQVRPTGPPVLLTVRPAPAE